jgi:amino acid permease
MATLFLAMAKGAQSFYKDGSTYQILMQRTTISEKITWHSLSVFHLNSSKQTAQLKETFKYYSYGKAKNRTQVC